MNIKYMQQMSDQICTNTKENKSNRLIDARDGKSYLVTKLRDGNCWMTQNLAYDGGGIERIYDKESNKCLDWVNDNSIAQYCAIQHTHNSYASRGNYYSWLAAMNGDASAAGRVQGVCPKGWYLPTVNYSAPKGSFGGLVKAYNVSGTPDGLATMHNEPLYFQYGGYTYANSISGVNTIGYYWSSVSYASASAYMLSIDERGVNPTNGHSLFNGMSVRCLALTTETNLEGNGNTNESLWPDPSFVGDDKANLSITVSPVISIDATSGMSSEVDFTTVAHGDITATISSNQKYQVLLSTNQSTLEQSPIVPNHNIPMITTDTTITPGTRAWGIKRTNSALAGGTLGDTTANTLFSPIGIGNNKVLFYESLGAESKTITFPVAISVDSTLPSGTYATEVTITATAN